jgi:hypothetical protein
VRDEAALLEIAGAIGVAGEYEQRVEQISRTLFDLDSVGSILEEPDRRRVVSVTGLVTYAQCPKRFYWSDIDPLPRRRSNAAIAGTELHRRIELHQRGQVPFEVMEPGLYDATDDEHEDVGAGGFRAFSESLYGTEPAALVEAPFVIEMDNGYQVRGRIDAVYVREGNWEIVDFKSGRRRDDPSRMVQLQAYALAATEVDFGLDGPEQIDVSFAYLGGGLDVHTERADEGWRAGARRNLEQLTEAIDGERFEPVPGAWCGDCDFLRFCEPGKQKVGHR